MGEDDPLQEKTQQLASQLKQKGWMVAVAESCTGGWLAKVMTDLPGSSEWFDRGFVTYSNDSKQDMLGVSSKRLKQFGAVSGETVEAMALGAIQHSQAQVAVAISGVAGPGGGSEEKPVGTVYFAWAGPFPTVIHHQCFAGDRNAVRFQAVELAIQGLLESLCDES